ncbi:MAG: hypothetical protein PHO01_10785 [Desulfotomaculaceae bacterium]|nr:hypothetical protein [Desulfotomaculaceae bacterium]
MKKPVMVVYTWNPKTSKYDIPVIFVKTLPDRGNKHAKLPQPPAVQPQHEPDKFVPEL